MLDKIKAQMTDFFIEKMLGIFPEVVLEADELRELLEKSAASLQIDPESGMTETSFEDVTAHLLETTQQVHPEVFEDVSGSLGERLLCQWSLRGFAHLRAEALRTGDTESLARVAEGVQELREHWWGAAFPDLFEKYDRSL